MSRSRRRPWATDYSRTKYLAKRLANKRVRRFKREMPEGNWFKKLYSSYNICDYRWYEKDNRELTRK